MNDIETNDPLENDDTPECTGCDIGMHCNCWYCNGMCCLYFAPAIDNQTLQGYGWGV